MSHPPGLDPADAARAPGRGRRVLVVDDDPLNLKLATLHLRDAGFKVETASTAEAALEKMAAAPPDAVLTDVQMPGMDGFALRRAVQDDDRLSRIPVVVVSAAFKDDKQRQAASAGGICVVRTSDLREAIDGLAAALERSLG